MLWHTSYYDNVFLTSASFLDQSDSDEIFIVLIVLLVICALGIIGAAMFFIARRNRNRSREEGNVGPIQPKCLNAKQN